MSVSVSGLPAGLSASGGAVSGRISASASAVTTNRRSIGTQTFPVTVSATDSRGATSSRTINWSVRDAYTAMPNYIDQYGNASNGRPDVDALSNHVFDCAYDPNGTNQFIYRQSVAPGTVIAWGQTITYWYGKNDTSCPHVAKGW